MYSHLGARVGLVLLASGKGGAFETRCGNFPGGKITVQLTDENGISTEAVEIETPDKETPGKQVG